MALNVVVRREIWGFCPSFLLGALSGNRHSSTSYGAEATSCGNVWRMSVAGRRRKWVDRWKRIAFVERAI